MTKTTKSVARQTVEGLTGAAIIMVVAVSCVAVNENNEALYEAAYMEGYETGGQTAVALQKTIQHWSNSFDGRVAYNYYKQRAYSHCFHNLKYSSQVCNQRAEKAVTDYLNANWHPNYQVQW